MGWGGGDGWKLQPSLWYKTIEDIRKDFKQSSQDFDLVCKGILSGAGGGVLALSLCAWSILEQPQNLPSLP